MPSPPRLLALCLFVLLVCAAQASAAAPRARCAIAAERSACPALLSTARPSLGLLALREARRYLGVPYSWGGESRGGLDCSGLVVVSFRGVGRRLPHYSGALWTIGRPVGRKNLEKGDLVFFRLSGGVPGHVGIYAGRGRYIHSPQSGEHVRYSLLSERADDFAGARRLR